jgi:hypothetical protein
MLLPGICSLIFMAAMLPGGGSTGGVEGLWAISLLIAVAGIILIWFAAKNR